MKLTQSNLNKLLAHLGIQDVQIVDDEKEADKFDDNEIVNAFLETKKPIFFQNFEAEILPDKLKAEAGKFGGNLKNTIKKLSNSQIKDSDMSGKKDEEVLQMFADFLHKDKDTSNEDLRTQIKTLSDSQNEALTKLKEEYEQKLSGKDREFDDLHITSYLGTLVNDLPLIGDDANVKIDVLKNALTSNYSPVWNREKKDLELREKANPERIAQLNENTILSPKAYAESLFKGLGMIKKDMSTESATKHVETGNMNSSRTDMQTPGNDLPFAGLVANMDAAK